MVRRSSLKFIKSKHFCNWSTKQCHDSWCDGSRMASNASWKDEIHVVLLIIKYTIPDQSPRFSTTILILKLTIALHFRLNKQGCKFQCYTKTNSTHFHNTLVYKLYYFIFEGYLTLSKLSTWTTYDTGNYAAYVFGGLAHWQTHRSASRLTNPD